MLQPSIVRIVIIDDDEDDFFIISEYIREIEGAGFLIDWCNNYDEAIVLMRNRKYDIYFVDYRLGMHTGLELLQAASAMDLDDPFILFTGKGSKHIDMKAMQHGATDYLIKSELNAEKIERSIRYALERAAILKELKSRESKYRNLFENSKDAIFIASQNLVFTEVNKAASDLLSIEAKDLVNKSLLNFIRSEEKKEQLISLFAMQDSIKDIELELITPAKEVKHCLLSLSSITNRDGVNSLHGILHDISNIRKAEMAKLQTQRLAANERLMRTLAHEIRNPLNNIALSAEQLSSELGEDEMQVELFSIIQRNSLRINHIITELLDLSKPLELDFQPHALQEILDESINMAQDRINLQKIMVEKIYCDSPLEILANKSKLIIAFTNILINAVESMEPVKGLLVVTLEKSPEGYNVSIRDNGNGIPAEYLNKLFEPFFTLKKNGTGLGLAASYTIFQSHQANIRVTSEVNEGTEFIVSFIPAK